MGGVVTRVLRTVGVDELELPPLGDRRGLARGTPLVRNRNLERSAHSLRLKRERYALAFAARQRSALLSPQRFVTAGGYRSERGVRVRHRFKLGRIKVIAPVGGRFVEEHQRGPVEGNDLIFVVPRREPERHAMLSRPVFLCLGSNEIDRRLWQTPAAAERDLLLPGPNTRSRQQEALPRRYPVAAAPAAHHEGPDVRVVGARHVVAILGRVGFPDLHRAVEAVAGHPAGCPIE